MTMLVSLPPVNAISVAVSTLQAFATLTMFAIESDPNKASPYSKFFKDSGDGQKKEVLVSGRTGMLWIYAPATIYTTYLLMIDSRVDNISSMLQQDSRTLLVTGMLLIHFLKRCLETLFLHKYSNSMALSTGVSIGVYYTFVVWIVTYFHQFVSSPSLNLNAGIALFLIGEVGNLYHHHLLSSLRTDSSSTRQYKIPQGGLFALVTMPHYFFELLAWLGIAVTSSSLNSFLVVMSMTSYLFGRSVATRRWYLDTVKGYPRERRAIVPFLF